MTRPRVLLSGRVVLDDGGPLAKSVVVQTICKGEKRIAAHTDSQGRFSFMIGEMHSFSEAMRGGVEDASVSARGGMSVAGDTPVGVHKLLDWRACGVTAELPGFISEVAELMVRTGDEGGDIGIITLRRTARVEGLTVSATSAAAPVAARKAFEKALAQEKNNKWDAAQKSLQKAVQLYPSYAVAWFELGRVQVLKKDIDQAKRSFAQSLAIDANYMNPYLELSRIEAREQAWQSLADLTAKSIALNSTASPEIWFFNGVANYNLQRLDDAEKSARLGLKLDSEHQFSKLEYLLGIVLEEKHQYTEAIEHMQAYLHLVNSPRDVEAAQKELAELSKLTGTTTISGATPPKN
ncbi:MAG: tetratricopeptide repeat protein [Terriglobales bacterium]|nr:tetratricopeptide repeat protein [Terriglobales bacterium]